MNRALLIFLLLLAACREQGPPSPTPQQNQQLNEAEAMLNQIGKEEGPETNAAGPSNSSD